MSYTDYDFKANVLSKKTADNHLADFTEGDILFLKDKGLPIPADKVSGADSVDKGKIPTVNANGGYELMPSGEKWHRIEGSQLVLSSIMPAGTAANPKYYKLMVRANYTADTYQIYTSNYVYGFEIGYAADLYIKATPSEYTSMFTAGSSMALNTLIDEPYVGIYSWGPAATDYVVKCTNAPDEDIDIFYCVQEITLD